MDCTFCKKSAAHLTPHNLCNLCLVHVECCEIDDILSDNGGISPPPDDDAEGDEQLEKELHLQDVREECDICLEKVLKNDLEQHREMCSPRIVYHCAICSDDYLSKEGLWNHLDLHEIVDEDKELNYSEVRTAQELQKCVLCNDQRGYMEKRYWEHVHEDHDGYFLRCIECGESFRSKKQQINHTLRNCKAGAEKGQEVISLNLPLQINVLANFSKLYEQAQANTTNVDIISYIREKGDSLKEVEIKPDYRTQIEVKTHSSDKEKNSTGKESHKPKDMDHKPAEADNRENESNCGQGMSLKRKYQEDNTFSCGICAETRNDFYELVLHVKQNHYEEAKCQKLLGALNEPDRPDHQNESQGTVATKESRLTDVEQAKSSVENCPICGESMRDRDQLTLHVKENHRMITCSGCDETYIDLGHAIQNQQSPRTGSTLFDLNNCQKQPGIKCVCYSRANRIQNDSNIYLDDRDSFTDGNPRFQCPCCAEKFQEKKQLQRHMSEHVNEIINKKFKLTSPQKDSGECPDTQSSEIEETSSLS